MSTEGGVERRERGCEGSDEPARYQHRLLELCLALVRCPRNWRGNQRPEIERREGSLAATGCMRQPGMDEAGTEVEQQDRWTAARRGGTGHSKGVDDLWRDGWVFGIDLIEEEEDITEAGVRMVHCEPGMEAVEGGVVRRGTKYR